MKIHINLNNHNVIIEFSIICINHSNEATILIPFALKSFKKKKKI